MKKIAIFVEGQTEVVFTQNLLNEIIGNHNLQIESVSNNIHLNLSRISEPNNNIEHFVLLVDCGGDITVKQKIKDNEQILSKSGYSRIIGLRDLYPLTIDNLPRLEEGLRTGIGNYLPSNIIIAVMEIECWFIQVRNHFLNIDATLTPEYIETNTGFNPQSHDATLIQQPSLLLNAIYNLVGLEYKKKLYQSRTVCDFIDYEELYFETTQSNNKLKQFIDEIEFSLFEEE
ncbi:MAG: hypothetical protein KZQ87_19540 [Candidatus Thiodiazotropha sp. (ex Cardiolucina cf. quadrata)]|nr:hypothetical protein [Candidatus Thiodiazotropha sp. (ex Cardiolucina cf. quadrata)]